MKKAVSDIEVEEGAIKSITVTNEGSPGIGEFVDVELKPTGKIRAVQNPFTFQFDLEQQYSDGSWQPYGERSFVSIQNASDWFAGHKKALKFHPAMIGDLND